jgi:hypothetical protein
MRRKQKAVDNRTRDKEGLKRWYERKVVQSEQKRDRLIAEQEKLLGSAVRYQMQQLVRFPGRLIPEVATAKRTTWQKLEKVARDVMKEHNLETLIIG